MARSMPDSPRKATSHNSRSGGSCRASSRAAWESVKYLAANPFLCRISLHVAAMRSSGSTRNTLGRGLCTGSLSYCPNSVELVAQTNEELGSEHPRQLKGRTQVAYAVTRHSVWQLTNILLKAILNERFCITPVDSTICQGDRRCSLF